MNARATSMNTPGARARPNDNVSPKYYRRLATWDEAVTGESVIQSFSPGNSPTTAKPTLVARVAVKNHTVQGGNEQSSNVQHLCNIKCPSGDTSPHANAGNSSTRSESVGISHTTGNSLTQQDPFHVNKQQADGSVVLKPADSGKTAELSPHEPSFATVLSNLQKLDVSLGGGTSANADLGDYNQNHNAKTVNGGSTVAAATGVAKDAP